ncbi:type II secretion system F family protein [Sphingomicrobium sediminis]|uniref:Type II secretion system F family protein n=1 Tax=Sphingomicrobium sediminis TaxID=2950949 RepID=A0A9X2EGK9_9SPHN|nr:type II secretion system F family protein [Sphingomicrobium sediminis]MCM8557120.1 type II secretion system F family protein [Sphingomicrobium sediminis]
MLLVLMIVGLLGAGALAYFAFQGPSPQKALKRRVEVLRERHSPGGATQANAQAQIRKLMEKRKNRADSFAATLVPRPALMQARLKRTGKNIELGRYAIINAVIFGVVAALLMLQGFPFLLAIMVGLLVGIGLPHMAVSRMIKKRINTFTANFPDAIELMVRGLRSGLPITETLAIVANEIKGPVADEFKIVADKMKVGKTMESALQDTADRLETPEFQFFVITLAIQRETGGNLAETLSNLADVLRKRSQMKLKIRAMSSESKASAWIVGSLPFIVFALIMVINPPYMLGFFQDERLIIAGIGGLVWMSIGVGIMAKMVSFEI